MAFFETLAAVIVGMFIYREGSVLYSQLRWKMRDSKALRDINKQRKNEGLDTFGSWEEYNVWDLERLLKSVTEFAEEEAKAEAAAKKRAAAAKRRAASKAAAEQVADAIIAAATKPAAKKPAAKKAPARNK